MAPGPRLVLQVVMMVLIPESGSGAVVVTVGKPVDTARALEVALGV